MRLKRAYLREYSETLKVGGIKTRLLDDADFELCVEGTLLLARNRTSSVVTMFPVSGVREMEVLSDAGKRKK